MPRHCPPQPFDSPQRRPTQDGVHAQWGGEPPHVSPMAAHCVPTLHVPPQPSLGALPQGRVDGGVQVGAQHVVPVQRSPLGHMVPFGHIGQPAGSVGLAPHASVLGEAHAGQHMPLLHVLPAPHAWPTPHVRHTAPVVSR